MCTNSQIRTGYFSGSYFIVMYVVHYWYKVIWPCLKFIDLWKPMIKQHKCMEKGRFNAVYKR